jgi:uroporphyrinogen decarboxylase
MDPRSLMLGALRREIEGYVPFETKFTPPVQEEFERQTGQKDQRDYFGLPFREVQLDYLWIEDKNTAQFMSYYDGEDLPEGTYLDEYGIAHAPGSLLHFTRLIHPLRNLKTIEEVEAYPLPEAKIMARIPSLRSQVEAIQARGLAAVAFMEMTIFEPAWLMRSMDGLFMDMNDNPELAEAWLDRITNLRVKMARALAESGVDLLKLGDDIAMQTGPLMSPATWRRWFQPRLTKVIAAAREVTPDLPVYYHSDGAVEPFIEGLMEAGVTVLNPLQPECVEILAVKARYGDRLSFWGGLGTQSTMPWGSADEVRRVTKELLCTLGKGGGFLIAPTHVLEPEVPWENITAFVETVQEHNQKFEG